MPLSCYPCVSAGCKGVCELNRGVNQATAFRLTQSVCSNHIWDGGCAAVSTDIQQHQADAQEAC